MVKRLPAMRETRSLIPGGEDPLEKEASSPLKPLVTENPMDGNFSGAPQFHGLQKSVLAEQLHGF